MPRVRMIVEDDDGKILHKFDPITCGPGFQVPTGGGDKEKEGPAARARRTRDLPLYKVLLGDKVGGQSLAPAVKEVARDLEAALAKELADLYDWTAKEQTRARVKVFIRNFLYDDEGGLPGEYTEEEAAELAEVVYYRVYEEAKGSTAAKAKAKVKPEAKKAKATEPKATKAKATEPKATKTKAKKKRKAKKVKARGSSAGGESRIVIPRGIALEDLYTLVVEADPLTVLVGQGAPSSSSPPEAAPTIDGEEGPRFFIAPRDFPTDEAVAFAEQFEAEHGGELRGEGADWDVPTFADEDNAKPFWWAVLWALEAGWSIVKIPDSRNPEERHFTLSIWRRPATTRKRKKPKRRSLGDRKEREGYDAEVLEAVHKGAVTAPAVSAAVGGTRTQAIAALGRLDKAGKVEIVSEGPPAQYRPTRASAKPGKVSLPKLQWRNETRDGRKGQVAAWENGVFRMIQTLDGELWALFYEEGKEVAVCYGCGPSRTLKAEARKIAAAGSPSAEEWKAMGRKLGDCPIKKQRVTEHNGVRLVWEESIIEGRKVCIAPSGDGEFKMESADDGSFVLTFLRPGSSLEDLGCGAMTTLHKRALEVAGAEADEREAEAEAAEAAAAEAEEAEAEEKAEGTPVSADQSAEMWSGLKKLLDDF